VDPYDRYRSPLLEEPEEEEENPYDKFRVKTLESTQKNLLQSGARVGLDPDFQPGVSPPPKQDDSMLKQLALGFAIDKMELADVGTSLLGGWLGIGGMTHANDMIDEAVLPWLYQKRAEDQALATGPQGPRNQFQEWMFEKGKDWSGSEWMVPQTAGDVMQGLGTASLDELGTIATGVAGEMGGIGVASTLLARGGAKGVKVIDDVVNEAAEKARLAGMEAQSLQARRLDEAQKFLDEADGRVQKATAEGDLYVERRIFPASDIEVANQYKDPRHRVQRVTNWMSDNFADKYSVYSQLSPETMRAVQRYRHASGTSQAPFRQGSFELDKVTGEYVPIGESFDEIWAGVDPAIGRDAAGIMVARRNIALRKKKGVKITPENHVDSVKFLKNMETKHGTDGMAQIDELISRHNKWRDANSIDSLIEVGLVTRKDMNKMVKANPDYAPFFRGGKIDIASADDAVREGILEQIWTDIGSRFTEQQLIERFGNKTLVDYLTARSPSKAASSKFGRAYQGTPSEKALAEADRTLVNLMNAMPGELVGATKGGGRSVEMQNVFKRITKGAGEDTGKVLDPIEADVLRVQGFQRLVEKQRVRNAIGESIEKSDWLAQGRYQKWTENDFIREFGPQKGRAEMDKMLNRDDTFVRFVDGKRHIYQLHDPRAVRAMNDMNGGQATLFNKMMNSPWGRASMAPTRMFRSGVVLGPDFQLRNVSRDSCISLRVVMQ
jgi:hypothetical protein